MESPWASVSGLTIHGSDKVPWVRAFGTPLVARSFFPWFEPSGGTITGAAVVTPLGTNANPAFGTHIAMGHYTETPV